MADDDNSPPLRLRLEGDSGIKILLVSEKESPARKGLVDRALDRLSNPFVMWVLGTVVAGIVGLLWSAGSGWLKQRAETEAQIQRLRGEITLRLSDARLSVGQVQADVPDSQGQKSFWVHDHGQKAILLPLTWRAVPPGYQAAFPEFSQRTLLSLLRELQVVAGDPWRARGAEAEKAILGLAEALNSDGGIDAAGVLAHLDTAERAMTDRKD